MNLEIVIWDLFFNSIQSFLKNRKQRERNRNRKILVAFKRLHPIIASYIPKIVRFQQFLIVGIISLFLTLNILPVFSQTFEIHKNLIEQLQQQSQTYYEQGEFTQAAEKLQEIINKLENQEKENLAVAWTNLGIIQLAIGKAELALKSWQSANQIYIKLGDQKSIYRLQIYRAKAWQKLGYYLQGCEELSQSLQLPSNICKNQKIDKKIITQQINENKNLEIFKLDLEAWRSLGDNLRLLGKLENSLIILEELDKSSLDLNPQLTQLSLGNTLRAFGNLERDRQAEPKYKYLPWQCELLPLSQEINQKFYKPALLAYEKASKSHSIITETTAQLKQFELLLELGRWQEAKVISEKIDLSNLTEGQSRIFSQINYAKNLTCLYQQENLSIKELIEVVTSILETAKEDAKKLNLNSSDRSLNSDNHLLSYVLGNLGSFYEYLSWKLERDNRDNLELANPQEHREKAIQLTQEALYLAQAKTFPHIAYQWQWQLGRTLAAKGDRENAITSYELAVKTLATVRKDLLTINSDIQFSFRDRVEPLYRQLVSLLITSDRAQNSPINLGKSIYYIEALQVAELENFLQCQLTEKRTLPLIQQVENLNQQIEQVLSQDKTSTLLYPIILENQIIVILKKPDQPIQYYRSEVSYQEVEKTVTDLQAYLTQPDRLRDIQTLSSQLYRWLIQPLEKELEREINREDSQVKTLVFVLDTSLRNIPMSVLYDRQRSQYLLERYSTAVISSSQLLKPRKLNRELKTLLGGLSQAITIEKTSYPSLKNVLKEFQEIQAVTLSSIELIDQTFTKTNIERQLRENNFSIIHLATHGQFSSDPEETFIILFDERLKGQDLTRLLTSDRPLELLVLSACETATGDKRAVLGLAGVAIRSEALSTVATLWQVDDESTAALMSQFYLLLKENPQINKAEALREAQLQLWHNQQKDWEVPFFWGAYVLVGNWL